MLGKNQMRIISLVLAVALLVVAFMVGVLNKSDDKLELKQVQQEYTDFKTLVDGLSENDQKLADGKAEYDEEKAAYDEDKAAYDKAVADCDAAEVKFDEDVIDYNSKIVQYNVGKDAVSSGKDAYDKGKAQLDAGWETVNQGEEQLKNYEKAKSAYNSAKAQYDEGLAAYNKLTDAIAELEDKGMPHVVALTMVSATTGQIITDDSLDEMQSQLSSAKKQLDTAKKQLDQAEKAKQQLSSAKKQLQKGESELKNAQSQLAAGEKQVSELEKEISGGQERLDAQLKQINDTRAQLEQTAEELDARNEKLKEYESISEKMQRNRDRLIDAGYGTNDDDNATILAAAQKHEDRLHSEYLKATVSYTVTNAAYMFSILAAVVALVMLKKGKLKPSAVLAVTAAALGAVSLIASVVFGSVHSLAFAAAVFTAVGVCLTERPEAAK